MNTDTVVQDSKSKESTPYVPWRTFFNFLEKTAEDTPPPRIDRTYIKNLDGTAQAQLMAALKAFDAIGEDGTVRQPLLDLIGANRKTALERILRAKYPEAIALAEQNATQGQLDEAFRAYGLNGDTLRRAESFFLNAADYAGIPMSRNFKKPRSAASSGTTANGEATAAKKRTPANGGRKPRGTRTTGGGGGGSTDQQQQPPVGDSRFITLSDGKTTLSLNLSSGVFSLPIADRKWVLSVLDMFDTYEADQHKADSGPKPVVSEGGGETGGSKLTVQGGQD